MSQEGMRTRKEAYPGMSPVFVYMSTIRGLLARERRVISQGPPTEYGSLEVNEWGFIQRRVMTGLRREEDRIDRPMVVTSEGVEYIPPALRWISALFFSREWVQGTYAVSSPRSRYQTILSVMTAESFEEGGNLQEEAVKLRGLYRLFSTMVGKSTPVMFSNA